MRTISWMLHAVLSFFRPDPTRDGYLGKSFHGTRHTRCIELHPREDFHVRSAFEIEG